MKINDGGPHCWILISDRWPKKVPCKKKRSVPHERHHLSRPRLKWAPNLKPWAISSNMKGDDFWKRPCQNERAVCSPCAFSFLQWCTALVQIWGPLCSSFLTITECSLPKLHVEELRADAAVLLVFSVAVNLQITTLSNLMCQMGKCYLKLH